MYLFGTGEPFCVLLGLSSILPIIIYIIMQLILGFSLLREKHPLIHWKDISIVEFLKFSVFLWIQSALQQVLEPLFTAVSNVTPALLQHCKIENALCWLSNTAHVWQNLFQMSKFFFKVLFIRFLSGNCDIISCLITVKEAWQ